MCLSPITFRNSRGKVVTVPCGHCLECVKAYQTGWSIRFEDEMKYWRYAYFITLTYADNKIKRQRVVLAEAAQRNRINAALQHNAVSRLADCRYRKSEYDYARCTSNPVRDIPVFVDGDLQSFIKRVRKSLSDAGIKSSSAFAYYACQEYGTLTYRPHYHMLVFSDLPDKVLKPLFLAKWSSFGAQESTSDYFKARACDFQSVVSPRGVARYVSKYITKPPQFENPYVVAGILPRPHRYSSKGIGRRLRDDVQKRVSSVYACYNVDVDMHDPTYKGVVDRSKLTDDFYNSLDNELYVNRTSPKFGVYRTRLPRYIVDSVFQPSYHPQNRVVSDEVTGKVSIQIVYVKRKDANHCVASGYHAYRLKLADRRDSELELQYMQEHPTATYEEMCRDIPLLKKADLYRRKQDALRHFANYYAYKTHRGNSLAC